MELTLSVLTYRGLPPTRPTQLVVSDRGASVGRNADNDLMLPDPDRFVSGVHARIQYRDGEFHLLDSSTNGTYVNHAPNPVGRGNSVALHDGDVLSVGEYEVRVSLRAVSSAPPMPGPAAPPPLTPAAPPVSRPPMEEPDENLDPLALMSAKGGGRPASGIPDDFELQAPTAPKSPPPPSRPAPSVGIPEDFDLLSPTSGSREPVTTPDHVPEDRQAYAPPEAIPEDFDLLSGLAPAAPPPKAPAPPKPPVYAPPPPEPEPQFEPPGAPPAEAPPEPRFEPPGPPSFEPPPEPQFEPPGPPGFEPTPEQTFVPPGEPAFAPVAEEEPRRPTPPRPPAAPAAPAQPAAMAPGDQALLEALLDGLGLHATVPPEAQPALARTVGQLVRVTTEGLMRVLAARTSFKRELRIEMTTIKPVENNPLKFSVDPDDALGHMLTGQQRGYLPAVQATQEALDDVLAHELAIIAGLKAALQSLLARFDPEDLEKRFGGDSVLGNLLPMARKAKCWEIFGEIHGEVARDAEEGFLSLFGDEFIKAYEEQVLKLKTARAGRPR